ncbi:unnamed protein product [Linum tenue]|uniref:Uncharacterized protein n=1 Tax=Linum tenue TaxID=586396 RepID=A0AAV0Q6B6_9ROSI|nr:unnamed protein product [Linum tenue]
MAAGRQPPTPLQEPGPLPRLGRRQPPRHGRSVHVPDLHDPLPFLGEDARVLHRDLPPQKHRAHPPHPLRQLPQGPTVAGRLPRPAGPGHLQQRRRHLAHPAQDRRPRVHHPHPTPGHGPLGQPHHQGPPLAHLGPRSCHQNPPRPAGPLASFDFRQHLRPHLRQGSRNSLPGNAPQPLRTRLRHRH